MSSKTQFKETLKNEKKIIADLRKQLEKKDSEIIGLKLHIKTMTKNIERLEENRNKKWWQFWR